MSLSLCCLRNEFVVAFFCQFLVELIFNCALHPTHIHTLIHTDSHRLKIRTTTKIRWYQQGEQKKLNITENYNNKNNNKNNKYNSNNNNNYKYNNNKQLQQQQYLHLPLYCCVASEIVAIKVAGIFRIFVVFIFIYFYFLFNWKFNWRFVFSVFLLFVCYFFFILYFLQPLKHLTAGRQLKQHFSNV